MRRYNIDIDAMNPQPEILDMRHKPEDVLAELHRMSEDAGGPFGVIFVDTFAAMFDGDDTNKATQAGGVYAPLATIHFLAGEERTPPPF
jgi:hypothetical protein